MKHARFLPVITLAWLSALGCIQVREPDDDEGCNADKDCASDRVCKDGECVERSDEGESGGGGTGGSSQGGTGGSSQGGTAAGGTAGSAEPGGAGGSSKGGTGGTEAGGAGGTGGGASGRGGGGAGGVAACTSAECTESFCAMATIWCDWNVKHDFTGFESCTECMQDAREGAYDLPYVYCRLAFFCWNTCAEQYGSQGNDAVSECIVAVCDSANVDGTGLCQQCDSDADDICAPPLSCNEEQHQCVMPG